MHYISLEPFTAPSSPPGGQEADDDDGESLFELTPIYDSDLTDASNGMYSHMQLRDGTEFDTSAHIAEFGSYQDESLEIDAALSTLSSTVPTGESVFDSYSDYQACLSGRPEDITDTETVSEADSEAELAVSEFEGSTMEQLRDELQAILQDIRDTLNEVLDSPDTLQVD